MICLREVKKYCKEYWKIENYQEAVNDTTQTWECHHRFETAHNTTKLELQAMGFYFNRPFCELIFLTPTEHRSLHHKGKEGYWKGKEGYWKGKEGPHKGHYHTEEAKQRMSESMKGENNPNYKYYITAEELYDLYVVRGLTQNQIAKIYGCQQPTILLKLKKFNIKK